MKTVFLILLLTIPALAQTVTYDKFKDETRVSVYKPNMGLSIEWAFTYQGRELKENVDTFYVNFTGGRYCNGYCFKDPMLILLIDGERVDLSDGRHRLGDSAAFAVDRAVMEKAVNAKLVEYQVGPYEGRWKEKDIRKLFDAGTKRN